MAVKSRLGNADSVVFHGGRFTDTAGGLEHKIFSLILLDPDRWRSDASQQAINVGQDKRGLALSHGSGLNHSERHERDR